MKTNTLIKVTNHDNPQQIFIIKLFNYAICTLVVATLLLLPFTFSTENFSFSQNSAFAKDGGGKGGGNGGGNGGGKGGGKGGGNGNANGHGTASNHGATASALGSLNASHASPNAMANAAPNSNVGEISAALSASTDETGTVDIGTLSEVLGVTPEVAQAVADNAAAKSNADDE